MTRLLERVAGLIAQSPSPAFDDLECLSAGSWIGHESGVEPVSSTCPKSERRGGVERLDRR
jgi:hypothetical protein